jgi:predicted nucleotidyltransferase
MSATVQDYHSVLELVVEDVNIIRDEVTSLILFGSVARGDLLPGQSDMMDAFVFLRHGVFEDKARFLKALDVLSTAFERIADGAPGPFHPFFYWSERDPVPATFNCEMTTLSKVLLGEDIRDRIKSTASSRLTARSAFFEMRRLGSPLMVYLHKKELTPDDCDTIFKLLVTVKRDIPMSACMTLNMWVGQPEAVRELEKALPGLDTEVVERIAELQRQAEPLADPEQLRSLLKQGMTFVENLNDRLIDKLKAEAEPWRR